MTKKLSDLNNSLQFVPTPQSPARAGQIIQAASNDVSPWTSNGWLECDGSAVSRNTYADLFANVGTKYGIGDGSTTFNLPDGPRRTVEVDLGAFAGFTDQTTLSKSIATQDASGVWYWDFEFTGLTTVSASNVSLDISTLGISVDWEGPPNYIYPVFGGGNSNGLGGRAFFNTATTLNIASVTSGTVWGVVGRVRLTGKPTDNFVSQDSRFSTFDEALESIPMIKAYDDASNISMSIADATATKTGAVRLNSGFAATDTAYGFIRKPDGFIELNTGNGRGSPTGTAIRRWTNNPTNQGTAFTYTDDGTNGMSITVNRDCIATIKYYDRSSSAGWALGISLNASSLSTQVTDLAVSERKAFQQNDANSSGDVSWSGILQSGDIIRTHVNNDAGLTSIGREYFSIVEVMRLD